MLRKSMIFLVGFALGFYAALRMEESAGEGIE
jgi:hypothetical protein